MSRLLNEFSSGHVTSLPPHNGHLSTAANKLCPLGGRCREVQLYNNGATHCIIAS